jgi:hypothetical protein
MRALSIQQPWTYCITHGTKRVENRSWPTSFRGRVLLHAGKKRQRGVEAEIHIDSPEVDDQAMRTAPTGAIVGAATIVACVTPSRVSADQRIWAGGPWCFILEDVVAFDEPIPYRGKLGFFEVPYEIVDGALVPQ